MNGTTEVETEYEYIRIFRMSVIMGDSMVGSTFCEEQGGGYLYAHIDAADNVNQTQMAIYTVPAGHNIYIKKSVCTKADDEPCKIYISIRDIGHYGYNTPFRASLNYNTARRLLLDYRWIRGRLFFLSCFILCNRAIAV